MAARVHSYAQARSNRGRSNHRGTLAVLFGLVAALAVPVGIELTRNTVLLDAAYAIPVAAIAAVVSIMFARGARGTSSRRIEPAKGSGKLLAGRILAVTGLCFALSGTIAVVVYEILLRLEH